MKIQIPFSDHFANAMIQGRKTAITTYHRYGIRADFFEFFGHTFCIDDVQHVYLWRVARMFYIQEGCKSELDFIREWKVAHPEKGYRPNDKVYYHRFFRET